MFIWQKRSAKKVKGVTLMEILVAMVILTVGIYMVYNIFPLGFATSWRSKNRTIATQLAQQKLEELLNDKYAVDCQVRHSRTCMVRILESDYTSPEDYSTSAFDCRYFYGGSVVNSQVQDATFCGKDSGDISTASNWTKFTGYTDYWYHVNISPVTDPCKKYRSIGDMVRITVTVRGPITDMSQWATLSGSPSVGGNKRWDKLPVEVIVSTMKANKYVAFTTIDNTYDASGGYTNWHYGVFDNMGQGSTPTARTVVEYNPSDVLWANGRRIRVANIRNFTMFYNSGLADAEKLAKGTVSLWAKGSITGTKYTRTGNKYGIDNVLIVRELKQLSGTTVVKTYYSCQTNKIMRMIYDASTNPLTTASVPGSIVLYDPLYADSTLGVTPGNPDTADCYLDNSLVDIEKYYGTDIYSNTCYQLMKASYAGTQTASQPPSGCIARTFLPYYYDIPYNGSVNAKTLREGTTPNPSGPGVIHDPNKSWDYTGYYATTLSSAYKYPSGYTYQVKYYVIQLMNIKTP